MIRAIQQVVLKGFLICCLIGCTVTKNHNEGGNSIPDSWSMAVAQAPEECVSIDGEYQTSGIGQFKEGEALSHARLDAELGYVFPSDRMPEKVSISLDRENNLLNIQFGQPINLSFAMSTNCTNGWFKLEQRQTNQYLGDGTTLDYSVDEIELARSDDGDLIVHASFDIQSSSFAIFTSRDTGESWSRYQEIESKN